MQADAIYPVVEFFPEVVSAHFLFQVSARGRNHSRSPAARLRYHIAIIKCEKEYGLARWIQFAYLVQKYGTRARRRIGPVALASEVKPLGTEQSRQRSST